MLDRNEARRMEIYGKYRYRLLVDPYGFAIMNEDLWDDPEALDRAAREWQILQLKRKIDQLTVARDTHQQGIERAQRQIKKIEENGL